MKNWKRGREGEHWKWQRTGRCQPKQCGAFCCRVGPLCKVIPDTKRGRDDRRYYEAMGLVQIGELKEEKKTLPVLGQTTACKHLKNIRCSIHKTRPKICRDFPQHPDHDFYKICKQNGCTYRFKKVQVKNK